MNLKNKISQTKDIFWNVLGGGLVAMQSSILLIFVARFYNQEMSGMVSIAYAFAVLAFTIARYGIRNYQVTDQKNEYSFREYLIGRYFSVIVTIMLMIIYLGIQFGSDSYSLEKAIIVLEVVLLRMVNAVEDVYLGRLQQVGKFEIGAKLMALREMLLLIVIVVFVIIRIDLRIVLMIGIIFSALTDVIMIFNKRPDLALSEDIQNRKDRDRIRRLLKENFPLCLGTALAVYASNIPKYTTDWYLNEYSQAVVAYLILPVFTIALFSQFAYTPFVKQLGDAYQNGDITLFCRKIKFQMLFTTGLAVVICVLCLWIGLPILSYIYDIDLMKYKFEFVILLIGGALYALEYYLSIPVTIMHKQKLLGCGYIFAIIIAAFSQKWIVTTYEIIGVSLLYCAVNLLISLFFIGIIIIDVRHKQVK